MNGLEEVKEYIRSFICEKESIQKQITEIEEKRTQLAGQRNEKKNTNGHSKIINELGKQISELGNQSQELQNQLDFKFHTLKAQINLVIDNSIAEGIRKIRIINGEIGQLQEKSEDQKERNAKYQLQRQEFYVRFGRMPELSERAEKASRLQEKEATKSVLEVEMLKGQIAQIEEEIATLAKVKEEFKKGNWSSIIQTEEIEELRIEELTIGEMEQIEEIHVEEFEPIEELYVEEFKPIEEIKIEEFKEAENISTEIVEPIQENAIEEIEKLARAIVEEIVAEQTKEYIMEEQKIEEKENKEKVIIPLFGERAKITNIIIKFEDEHLVYKAQMSDGEEIKIYPSQLGEESVLLRDKQNREDCKEILINYAINEHKVLDKKVINQIDPLVCELLIECAERYGYNAHELVYNYAVSFIDGNSELVPGIIYNLSYIEQSNLSRKEKAIMNKICRYARKNNGIDIIEAFSGFSKIKYAIKRLFNINAVKLLPEAKY